MIRITWWEKQVDLLGPGKKKKRKEKNIRKKDAAKGRKVSFNKILSVIRSFQVREFILHVDTGNMQANGMLFPLFYGIGRLLKREVAVNFNDRTDIRIRIRNNAYRMLRAYLKS